MPRMHLDLEEWDSLYLAAMAIPEEKRRPCLKTAILGMEQIFSAEHGRITPLSHDCEAEECDKAYVSAIHRLDDKEDPFQIEHGERSPSSVQERLTELEKAVRTLVKRERRRR